MWIGDLSPDIWQNFVWNNIDPEERLFYVTHDRGKLVWWHVIGNNGNQNLCHPFCNNECYWPFNWRYCRGNTCRQPNVNGDVLTAPVGSNPWQPRVDNNNNIQRSLPPQCAPDIYDDNSQWNHWNAVAWNGNFEDARFGANGENIQTERPYTAVPLSATVTQQEPQINAVIPGTAPPPFAPVPHSEKVEPTTGTTTANRTESNEWWKWWLLFLALALLLLVLLLALCCGPKQRVRQPIKKVEEEIPIVVEEKVEVRQPKVEVVEEKVYKPTRKQVVIEKAPVKRVEEKVVVKEKTSFNPYKQKSVDFRL